MNAHKDFSKQVIKALKTKGIVIVAPYFIPDTNGDFTKGETAYKLVVNGTASMIRTYAEVRALAA